MSLEIRSGGSDSSGFAITETTVLIVPDVWQWTTGRDVLEKMPCGRFLRFGVASFTNGGGGSSGAR